ncbi:MAG: 6-bladed beta-propeller, partial [Candidatus Aminicenantes bacterium]|nr:6-bladed beta-propeller [Candidatus Aminicenantes bacterium]
MSLALGLSPEENPVQIKMGPSLEVGRTGILFGSISSVCEDHQENFYILDRKEFKVHKFSADGRVLQTFGQQGQGPGDFQSPNRIVFTSRGELAILEDLNYVSFFKTGGSFLRRLDLNGRLGLGYIGPNRYYGWIWRPEDRQQVVVDEKNAVISTFHIQSREAFSTLLPDETGRAVMFSYVSEFYVPGFLFDHNQSLSAVGISSLYRLVLLDENGQTVAFIERDLGPQKITGRERASLERDILEFTKTKGWPQRVGRELIKKIPRAKNSIRAVRISPHHIFVFRFAPDIARRDAPIPVDIFTRRG